MTFKPLIILLHRYWYRFSSFFICWCYSFIYRRWTDCKDGDVSSCKRSRYINGSVCNAFCSSRRICDATVYILRIVHVVSYNNWRCSIRTYMYRSLCCWISVCVVQTFHSEYHGNYLFECNQGYAIQFVPYVLISIFLQIYIRLIHD